MDAPRSRPELQLTRNHMFALGALSLSVAVMAFFVGMQVGRGRAPHEPPAPPVPPLVSDGARSGDLESLLAKVDQVAGKPDELGFAAELPVTDPPPSPVDPEASLPVPESAKWGPAAEVREGSAAVAPAASHPNTSDGVPSGGWAIQVGSREAEADAQALVVTQRAAGLAAYRVVALVGGRTVWKVRVGGYASKEAATAALAEVAGRAGTDDATVTPAP